MSYGRILRATAVAAAALGIACLFCGLLTGCEEGKGTSALTVQPSYVDLDSGGGSNAVPTFTVTAGLRELSLPLEWRVSDPSLGSIRASGGYSASYARTAASGVNSVIVKDQYGAEGVATVRQ